MKKALVILGGVAFLFAGCQSSGLYREAVISSEPTIVNWQSEEIFKVVEPVKEVAGGVDMGFVAVRRISDNALYQVAIIPFRDIPVGSAVDIVQLRHPTGSFNRLLLLK